MNNELPNFPFVDQLASPTTDGLPDENARMNCVPSCICAALEYFTGKKYNPNQIKDAVYGESYTGGTAAVDYVAYAAKQGVKLYSLSGNPDYLVSQVHVHLALGHPVIATIPSTYQPVPDRFNPGASHAICFYKEDGANLVAMNPWHAFPMPGTDTYWSSLFCFGQIWIFEKLPQERTSMVPQGWKDDGKTLVAPNGKHVSMGFRLWILAHSWNPDDYPLEDEHGDGQGGTAQLFRSRRLRWGPKRGVYEEWLGDEVANTAPAKIDMKTVLSYLESLKVQ